MKYITIVYFLSIGITIPVSTMLIKPESRYQWGYSYRQGRKNVDEDRYKVVPTINNDPNKAFFAVFDGHLGIKAAEIASGNLSEHFVNFLNQNLANPLQALQQAFAQTEKDILSSTDAGTTASVAFLDGNSINLSWVGDSKILVIPPTGPYFETSEHRPNNPEERNRLKNYPPSIWQRLNLTRALGNKKTKESYPGIIIATPELKSLPLQKNSFIVLASDGYWDMAGAETTKQLINQFMNKSVEELQAQFPLQRGNEASQETGDQKLILIARALVESAYRLNSPDNIAVMVIHVSNGLPPVSSAVGKIPVAPPSAIPSSVPSPMLVSSNGNPLTIVSHSKKSFRVRLRAGTEPDIDMILDYTPITPSNNTITAQKTINKFPVRLRVETLKGEPIVVSDLSGKHSYAGAISFSKEELQKFLIHYVSISPEEITEPKIWFTLEDDPRNPHGLILRSLL